MRCANPPGDGPPNAYARATLRSRPIRAAAATPRPATSPTTSPTRPPASGMTSYPAPATSMPGPPHLDAVAARAEVRGEADAGEVGERLGEKVVLERGGDVLLALEQERAADD